MNQVYRNLATWVRHDKLSPEAIANMVYAIELADLCFNADEFIERATNYPQPVPLAVEI